MNPPNPDDRSQKRGTDFHLAERLCSDEEAAVVELLVNQCGRSLEYLAGQFDYPDLLGDLYLHLKEEDWRRLRTWEGESSLRHWARQVAVRLCLKKAKFDKVRFRGIGEWDLNDLPERPESDRTPADGCSRGELLLAVQNLSSVQERLLILSHCIEGKPIHDVAQELGIPVGHAYVVKSRAIAHLRKALARRLADV